MALKLITAGESHGPGLTCIVEGLPAGLELDREAIDRDMARRQLGHGRGGRMKIETDTVEIRSGVRHGRTLGSPIAVLVANRDYANWEERMNPWPVEAEVPEVHLPRPGHADLVGTWKYGLSDVRDILERASARETAARVAGGALCKAFLRALGVEVRSHVTQITSVHAPRPEQALRLEDFDGFWIPRGWSKNGPIKTESRIDVPRSGATVVAGRTAVAGVAWAPARGISKVEVQVDGGPWNEARLGDVASANTWVQWMWEWGATPGDHKLRVRATDGTGETQTATVRPPAPDGATGYHERSVVVRNV
jgi:hypothetical protein